MNNKNIKKSAKISLIKNYWKIVAVIFFTSLILGKFSIGAPNVDYNKIPVLNSFNLDIASEVIESITKIKINLDFYKPTKGILANLFNNVTASGNFIFGFLNSLNQLFFHERIWASLIIMLGAILTFFYWLFIKNVIVVGEKRFFLENVNHKKTSFKRIFFSFKVKKNQNISLVMMKKSILEWLWWMTIIGGIIKHYSYILVPYILAENPDIKSKDAIKLSENMMKNHKWEFFKLDMSFILWEILSLFSFHLLNIIFISPYKKCAFTEFYMHVREISKKEKILNSDLLCDEYLLSVSDKYPKEKYIYPEYQSKFKIESNYEKNYNFISLLLMFFASSIIGWLWEVSYHLFRYGSLVNRGVFHGPWLPIYGFGGIILLIFLKRYRKNPVLTFILTLLICGLIEYNTSLYLEFIHKARWWNYTNYFLNINGRVCLEGLIAFGLGGCAFIYFMAPFIDSILDKIKIKYKIILGTILSIFFLIDFTFSTIEPNKGHGISRDLKTIQIKNAKY